MADVGPDEFEVCRTRFNAVAITSLLALQGHDHMEGARTIVQEIIEHRGAQRVLYLPSATQHQVFLNVRDVIATHPHHGSFQCGMAAHLIGDMLTEYGHFLKATGAFCVAMSHYEQSFRDIQTTIRTALQEVRPKEVLNSIFL